MMGEETGKSQGLSYKKFHLPERFIYTKPMSTSVLEPPVSTSHADAVRQREKDYLLQNYGRYPLVLARGRGAWLYDVDGKRYLDLISGIGVNALGHAHPRMLRVLREQAAKLIHCSNLYYQIGRASCRE